MIPELKQMYIRDYARLLKEHYDCIGRLDAIRWITQQDSRMTIKDADKSYKLAYDEQKNIDLSDKVKEKLSIQAIKKRN